MTTKNKKNKSLKKRLRNSVYGPIGQTRDRLYEASPQWAKERLWPIVDYLDMFFIDHGVFRLFYANRHRLTNNAWRSAQPWPHQIRHYAKEKGIKTIVNLRGERDCGSYRLEEAACKKHGVNFVNFKLRSGRPPEKDELQSFKDYFAGLEHPILLHCKSGADRAGIASVLYLMLNQDVPFEEAYDQLDIKYGHFKQAKTGVLDHFFETYKEANDENPIDFMEWVETKYDPVEVKQSFVTNYWSNFWVEKVLRRE